MPVDNGIGLLIKMSCLSVTLVYCGQAVGRIKVKLGTRVGIGPGHIVLDGDPAPLKQRGTAPNFQPICCRKMAGRIKMPLGREVGLGPRDIVLDGDPAPLPQKGAESPNFWPMYIVANRLDGLRCHLVWR